MSAPKPELIPELSQVVAEALYEPGFRSATYEAVESLVRKVVEIVARKSADIADQAIAQDASGYASTAILNHWGLK